MALPEGPGIVVSVDYFGPLPVTPRGNTYILLFTDRFSRRADMYAVTAAEFTAEGPANNGLQFCPKLSQAVYKLLGVRKIPPAPTTQKWQWRGGACETHDGPNAGNGAQRAAK